MALYGWHPYTPPKPDVNAGFVRVRPRKPPRSTFHAPKPVRPTPRHLPDPLAPLSDAQIQSKIAALLGPRNQAEIQAIQNAINERSRQGEAAILGNTQALGNLFAQAAPQTAAAYAQANQAVSGANQEVANRLNSFGQGLGTELQGKLGLQDAPSNVVGQVAGGAVNTAQGVSNANFAKGAAEVSRLAAEGAHAGEYAAKQPGFAALTGMQHSRELEAQLNKELADQLAAQSSRSQDTFVQLYSLYLNQNMQKALAQQSGQFKSQAAKDLAFNRAQTLAFKKATLKWDKAKAAADRREKAREANQRNATSKAGQAAANQRAAQSQRGQNLRQNKWQVNPDGTFKTRLNHKTGKRERIPIKPPKKGKTGSSSGL